MHCTSAQPIVQQENLTAEVQVETINAPLLRASKPTSELMLGRKEG